jgi:hypothetical protein
MLWRRRKRPRVEILRPGVDREPIIYWRNLWRFVGFIVLLFILRILYADIWFPLVARLLGH